MNKAKAKKKRKKLDPKGFAPPREYFSIVDLVARGRGQPRKFETPEALAQACVDYIDWVNEHPMLSWDLVKGKLVKVPKMQPCTWSGFTTFCGVSEDFFASLRAQKDYPQREDFLRVLTQINAAFRTQKFNGAATGLLNANIIARDLGLVDRQDHTSGGASIQAPVINIIKGESPMLLGSEAEVLKQEPQLLEPKTKKDGK